MIKTSIEQLSESIGYDIGQSDDHTQANMLNGFCKGMANSMREQDLPKQISYMVDKLDNKTHKVLKEIVEFIKLKEQE